ncbi:XkdF-like putative serine protease domain-containing protein [Endozoicomonas sp. ALB115]|uniref:XkdF-like putative serine protease domain-containing protein n=1 Tax=Endozoicomonas sp. ALB115 TaxID=3403074 RepID=UPI003BB80D67
MTDWKKLFTAPVLVPGEVDWHGDVYDEDAVEQACHDFQRYCNQAALQHKFDVSSEEIEFVENYILPTDTEMNGKNLKAGTWIATAKIHSDEIWEAILDGTFTGWSIKCPAVVEDVEILTKGKVIKNLIKNVEGGEMETNHEQAVNEYAQKLVAEGKEPNIQLARVTARGVMKQIESSKQVNNAQDDGFENEVQKLAERILMDGQEDTIQAARATARMRLKNSGQYINGGLTDANGGVRI